MIIDCSGSHQTEKSYKNKTQDQNRWPVLIESSERVHMTKVRNIDLSQREINNIQASKWEAENVKFAVA